MRFRAALFGIALMFWRQRARSRMRRCLRRIHSRAAREDEAGRRGRWVGNARHCRAPRRGPRCAEGDSAAATAALLRQNGGR